MAIKTYSNSAYGYIENAAMEYPNMADKSASTTPECPIEYNTGYHRIPNQLWQNWLNPKQWYDLLYDATDIRVIS